MSVIGDAADDGLAINRKLAVASLCFAQRPKAPQRRKGDSHDQRGFARSAFLRAVTVLQDPYFLQRYQSLADHFINYREQ